MQSTPRPAVESEAATSTATADSRHLVLAALLAGAGLIHLVMAPIHASEGFSDALGFAVAGWVQIALAVAALVGAARRPTLIASIVANAAFIGVWAASRTVGLPWGGHAGIAEPVALVDGVCVALQVAAVLLAGTMLAAPQRLRTGPVLSAVAAVAVLAVASAPLVSTATAEHDHDDTATAAVSDVHFATMADIDKRRCDLGFNPAGYWSEARAVGVDVYAGGAMAPHVTPRDIARQQEFAATPGTSGLDDLVTATSQAGGGEGAAAALVARLGRASDDDYGRWRQWLWSQSAAGAAASTASAGLATGATGAAASSGHTHSHGSTDTGSGGNAGTASAAPDDNAGHGGHVGPTPWVAMVDRTQCRALAGELERSRAVAMAHPTAADALADGYVKTTTFVPGIAAHYMKFSLVDGTFDIDQPEMLLYDGDSPDAHVVGLSYYLLHGGDAEPTQGFTGPNDHFHRHVGLCMKDNLVIGDSTTTAEACAARGGVKAGGSDGWMNHVWVVPGCESPWGVFSGASPLMDVGLARSSPGSGPGCSGSAVRARYDLSAGSRSNVAGVVELASGG